MKNGRYLPLGKSLIFGRVTILNEFPTLKQFTYANKKTNFKQEQIHDLLFKPEIRWQEIIYDLINTEELDPWDIDIKVLTEKYLERVIEMEESDFFVSSQVLLAAALLLRIKTEILLNKYIKSIDDILFGRKEKEKRVLERIELEDEIPDLIPKSPMPRFKKVTLSELIESLNKAIITENRRIKKEIIKNNAVRETAISLSKRKNLNISDKIREIYERLFSHLKENKEKKRVSFTELVGKEKEEKVISFYPLLQLENNSKVWLDQEKHFAEIFIWLKEVYLENNGDPFADIKAELLREQENLDEAQKKRVKKINKNFKNPIGEEFE